MRSSEFARNSSSWCSSCRKAIFGSRAITRDPASFFILARVARVYLRSTNRSTTKTKLQTNQPASTSSIADFQRWTSKSIKFRWIWVKVTPNGMVHAENDQDLRSGFTFCPCWAIQIVTCHLSLPAARQCPRISWLVPIQLWIYMPQTLQIMAYNPLVKSIIHNEPWLIYPTMVHSINPLVFLAIIPMRKTIVFFAQEAGTSTERALAVATAAHSNDTPGSGAVSQGCRGDAMAPGRMAIPSLAG